MRELHPHRVRWRAVAAGVVRVELAHLVNPGGHDFATLSSVAQRLGVSYQTVQKLCGDGDPAWALGDVLATGPACAAAVLRGCLVAVADAVAPAEDPRLVALQVTARVGRLADDAQGAASDGLVTPEEWARVDARLAEIEAEAARGRAAIRSALGRGRHG